MTNYVPLFDKIVFVCCYSILTLESLWQLLCELIQKSICYCVASILTFKTQIHPFSFMESHFFSPSDKITEFIEGDSLQLDQHPTAHVQVTWCGLILLHFNSENQNTVILMYENRHIKNMTGKYFSLYYRHTRYICDHLSKSYLFFYICHRWRRGWWASIKKKNKLITNLFLASAQPWDHPFSFPFLL